MRDADLKNPEDVFVKTRNAASLLNKYLERIATQCGIEKSLSIHIACHSFGNIAGEKDTPINVTEIISA